MKKNNYKPRIVEFEGAWSGKRYPIDTRKGSAGLYPGDIISCITCIHPGKRIVLGVDTNISLPILWFATPGDGGKIHNLMFSSSSEFTLVKRQAQHLIDNGEMIQVGEQ